MKKLFKQLWRDESGGVSGIATMLLYTILALGATVGLVTLRDQIVQEFGDLAVALDSLDQSWTAPAVGTGYTDTKLFPIAPATEADPVNGWPANLGSTPPTGEGPPFP